jgi:tetratricopeptide (TPR) repeat protein
MRKQQKSRVPEPRQSQARKLPMAWIGVAMAGIAAVAGFVLVPWIKTGVRSPKTDPVSGSSVSTPIGHHRAATNGAGSDRLSDSDSNVERALRQEQIDAGEKLLSEFPANDDAVYLAGLIQEEQGNSDAAIKLWARSIELDATRADAHESLGQALWLRDDYSGAEKHFRRALELDGRSPSARFRLATTLSQQGQLSEARLMLEQGPMLSADGFRLLGEICQQLQEFERARTNYEAAIRLKPDFAEAYYGLGLTLGQLGDAAGSRQCLDKSLALRREKEEEARRVRAQFDSLGITRQSVARTHTDVGRVYMRLGKAREAEQLWRRAAALDSKNVLCRLQLAVLHQQTGRDREALEFYEDVARLDPNDGLTQLNLGRVCRKLKLRERAEQAFQEVIRLEPQRPDGYRELAQLYLQTGTRAADAEHLATQAAELSPDAPSFALLCQAAMQNGNSNGALLAINKAISLQPENSQFLQMKQSILATKR